MRKDNFSEGLIDYIYIFYLNEVLFILDNLL